MPIKYGNEGVLDLQEGSLSKVGRAEARTQRIREEVGVVEVEIAVLLIQNTWIK